MGASIIEFPAGRPSPAQDFAERAKPLDDRRQSVAMAVKSFVRRQTPAIFQLETAALRQARTLAHRQTVVTQRDDSGDWGGHGAASEISAPRGGVRRPLLLVAGLAVWTRVNRVLLFWAAFVLTPPDHPSAPG